MLSSSVLSKYFTIGFHYHDLKSTLEGTLVQSAERNLTISTNIIKDDIVIKFAFCILF